MWHGPITYLSFPSSFWECRCDAMRHSGQFSIMRQYTEEEKSIFPGWRRRKTEILHCWRLMRQVPGPDFALCEGNEHFYGNEVFPLFLYLAAQYMSEWSQNADFLECHLWTAHISIPRTRAECESCLLVLAALSPKFSCLCKNTPHLEAVFCADPLNSGETPPS